MSQTVRHYVCSICSEVHLRIKILAFGFILLALGACAHGPIESRDNLVFIAPDVTMLLPHPSELSRSFESTQLVTAHYGDQVYAFEGHVSVTHGRFLMVGLDSFGRRAMTITWTDSAITYERAPWLPSQLRPQNILADMVLMYWPEHMVRQALSVSHCTLSTGPNWRSVMQDGHEIIHIEYGPASDGSLWSAPASYRHLIWNYQLNVQSTVSGQ
jgi:hypothetical protein